MKFFVNENCIGCGLCASTCPEIFSMTEDGVAKASAGPVPAEFCASCQLAMDECPVSALEREDLPCAEQNACRVSGFGRRHSFFAWTF